MSRVAHRRPREIALWFDSGYRGRNAFARARLLVGLVRSIQRAPLPPAERSHCLAEIPRATIFLSRRAALWKPARDRGADIFDDSRNVA
jgi:hypothetical protein